MTLEDILNTLIKRGWKPFGWKDIKKINNEGWFVCFVHKSKKRPWLSEVSHRELVSKESGLWQFVCEYVLIDIDDIYTRDFIDEGRDYIAETYSSNTDYEYWVLRSALCDEDELEQFLLDNIKIDE